MLTREQYNEETYSNYLNSFDYNGAINYLRSFKFDTKEDRQQIDDFVSDLERKRDKLEYLTSSDPQAAASFKFIEAYNNGSDLTKLADEGNTYAKQFTNNYKAVVDSLSREKIVFDTNVHKNYTLGIDLLNPDKPYDDTGWELFKHNLGLSGEDADVDKQLKDLGIQYSINDNGQYEMTFTNTGDYSKAMKVISALDATDTNHSVANGRSPINEDVKDAYKRWQFNTEHLVGKVLNSYNNNEIYDNLSLEQKAIDAGVSREDIDKLKSRLEIADKARYASPSGAIEFLSSKVFDIAGGLSEWAINKTGANSHIFTARESMDRTMQVYRNAQANYDSFVNPTDSEELTTDIKIFSSPTIDQQELFQDYTKSLFESKQYETINKEYNRVLLSKLANDTNGYLGTEIYAVDAELNPSEDDAYTLHKVTNDKEKQALIHEITGQIAKGTLNPDTDLNYAIAACGDGLMVTIEPEVYTGSDEDKGRKMVSEYGRRQIFIKGFVNTPITEKYRNSQEYKALRQIDECLTDGQPINVSTEDGVTRRIQPAKIQNNDGSTSIDRNKLVMVTTNAEGLYKEEDISKQKAHAEAVKKLTLDSAVNYAVDSLFDPKGNYRNNPNLDKQLDNVVNAALKEFYPEESQMAEQGEDLGYDVENQKLFLKQEYERLMAYIKNKVNNRVNNIDEVDNENKQ